MKKQNNKDVVINNQCSLLQKSQIEAIASKVLNHMNHKHEGYYTFNNLGMLIYNESYVDGIYSFDVDVSVDMTLIRNPEDSPLVKGMKQKALMLTNELENSVSQEVLRKYLAQVSQYYNVPIKTGFLYRINTPVVNREAIDQVVDFEMFHRIDIADKDVILTPAPDAEPFIELGTENDGIVLLNDMVINYAKLTRAVSYNQDAAVKYAVDNATAEPAFSSANGLGSDCANFVSKSINAGGIPVDKDGKWFPAPKAGSYAGDNWMRTGYNKNGGVVPYMTDKGYFDSTTSGSATLGSILYWNKKSHVALVTQIDGYTIKYSQHSSKKQSSTYFTYNSNVSITFYKPTI